ncbi:hypothetical protein KSF73_14130 [Burkholderiaceae bacterium DAT-1]|nr:hypothetical protein [Burkholderiaceae bacterium DAT-1]
MKLNRMAALISMASVLVAGSAQADSGDEYFTEQRNAAYGFAYTTYLSVSNVDFRCKGGSAAAEVKSALDVWKKENMQLMLNAKAYFSDYLKHIGQTQGQSVAEQVRSKLNLDMAIQSNGGTNALLANKEDGAEGCKVAAEKIVAGVANYAVNTEFYPILQGFSEKYLVK